MKNTRRKIGLTFGAYGKGNDSRHAGMLTPAYQVKHRRLTGLFNIAVGLIMIGMWLMLILTGQVTDLAGHQIRYGFHWMAELGTALSLIASGHAVLREHTGARRLYYLAAGLVFNAVTGAVVFYTIHWEPAILAMTGIVAAATAALVYLNRGGIEDLSSFSIGAVLYGGLNVTGNILDAMDYSSMPYIALVMVFGAVLFIERVRNRA